MTLLIKKIHDVVADLSGKNVATSRPPEQVDRILNFIIVDVFNKYLDNYVKTNKISDFLMHFKRTATLSKTGTVFLLPDGYAHFRAVYNATAGHATNDKEIELIQDKFWNRRANRKLAGPSEVPICRIENSEAATPVAGIEVLPTAVTSIKLLYFKTPREAVYGYTSSGTRYNYVEGSSVDLEFPIGLFPDIVNRLLNALGISLREGQLIQVSELLKTQEQAK